jgi:16S rRNA (uracil1498-N3)-methyltransferase
MQLDTHFFSDDLSKDLLVLDHEESHHAINVFRIQLGQEITIGDGKGQFVNARVTNIKKRLELQVTSRFIGTSNETGLRLILPPLKQLDRFLFAVEKAVELGVSEINVVHTQNTSKSFLKEEKIKKKAIAAFKQSRINRIPEINIIKSIADLTSSIDESLPKYFAHCNEQLPRQGLTEVKFPCYFFIGPEADFSSNEIETLINSNWNGVSLGANRLRAETAAIHVASFAYQTKCGNIAS